MLVCAKGRVCAAKGRVCAAEGHVRAATGGRTCCSSGAAMDRRPQPQRALQAFPRTHFPRTHFPPNTHLCHERAPHLVLDPCARERAARRVKHHQRHCRRVDSCVEHPHIARAVGARRLRHRKHIDPHKRRSRRTAAAAATAAHASQVRLQSLQEQRERVVPCVRHVKVGPPEVCRRHEPRVFDVAHARRARARNDHRRDHLARGRPPLDEVGRPAPRRGTAALVHVAAHRQRELAQEA
eukprot:360643-Chlamydomonas_euryale.AAC.2